MDLIHDPHVIKNLKSVSKAQTKLLYISLKSSKNQGKALPSQNEVCVGSAHENYKNHQKLIMFFTFGRE